MEFNVIILSNPKNGNKYYAVHCRCGHVGKNRYVEIVFAVKANSGKEAAAKARRFARVKHNKKNAILRCYEITVKEYNEIIKINKNDPYLKCKNIQEQRSIDGFESRIIEESIVLCSKKSKQERRELIKFKLKKQKQLIKTMDDIDICDYIMEKGKQYYESVR